MIIIAIIFAGIILYTGILITAVALIITAVSNNNKKKVVVPNTVQTTPTPVRKKPVMQENGYAHFPETIQEQKADYLETMEMLKYDNSIDYLRNIVNVFIEKERFPKIALKWFEAQVAAGEIIDYEKKPNFDTGFDSSCRNYAFEENDFYEEEEEEEEYAQDMQDEAYDDYNDYIESPSMDTGNDPITAEEYFVIHDVLHII